MCPAMVVVGGGHEAGLDFVRTVWACNGPGRTLDWEKKSASLHNCFHIRQLLGGKSKKKSSHMCHRQAD